MIPVPLTDATHSQDVSIFTIRPVFSIAIRSFAMMEIFAQLMIATS